MHGTTAGANVTRSMRSSVVKLSMLLVAYVVWIVLLSTDMGGDRLDTVVTLLGPIPLAMAVLAVGQPRSGPVHWLRGIAPGFLPGLVAGFALGVGLRLGMRLVALAAGLPGIFTIPGTLAVLLIGTILGGSFGTLLTAVWKSATASQVVRGWIGGTALAVSFWYPFFLAGRDDLINLVSMPGIILFTTLLSALWIGYGVMLAALMRRSGSLA